MAPKFIDVLALPFKPFQALGLPTPFVQHPTTPSTPTTVPNTGPSMVLSMPSGWPVPRTAITAPDNPIEGQIVPTGYPVQRPTTIIIPAATPLIDGVRINPQANQNRTPATPSGVPISQRTGARRITAIGGY
jgi:hypothetical protein